ncbi:MAG: hypothetical protein M1824_003151 [Vezdaea acicularis]|nr:MAG: hypothetical protein M1824_003151 [Vezdaea acicularis]
MEPKEEPKFAIHEAAREGRVLAVESLLNANPRLADRRDDDERLPIHWAVSYNHFAVVELLVQQKNFDADVQVRKVVWEGLRFVLILRKDASGWTPLMMAASLRDSDSMIDLLLRKEADVNIKTFNGQTALHFCASKNNLDAARKLIARGASARVKDKRGQLPLHRAAAIGSVPMVQLLLDNKSPVNATDISAISEGHGDTAMLLLKSGAETDKRDGEGHLAIDLAPDTKVRKFILQSAEREGINI